SALWLLLGGGVLRELYAGPLFTLLAAALAGVCFFAFEPLTAAFSLLLGLVMLAITISDARGFIIPDCLSLPAIPAGLLAAAFLAGPEPWHETVLGHLAGAALGGGLLYSVRFAYQAIR